MEIWPTPTIILPTHTASTVSVSQSSNSFGRHRRRNWCQYQYLLSARIFVVRRMRRDERTGVTCPCDGGSEMSRDEILKTGNVLHWRMSCGSSFQSYKAIHAFHLTKENFYSAIHLFTANIVHAIHDAFTLACCEDAVYIRRQLTRAQNPSFYVARGPIFEKS